MQDKNLDMIIMKENDHISFENEKLKKDENQKNKFKMKNKLQSMHL